MHIIGHLTDASLFRLTTPSTRWARAGTIAERPILSAEDAFW